MKKIKISEERQKQIQTLWNKFKADQKSEEEASDCKGLDKIITQWKEYREKIIKGTLKLEDYTNKVGSPTANMPGGYLCNFLERTTRDLLGSSKPGSAYNFEIKLNDDNSTYFIKGAEKGNQLKDEAEIYFESNIKILLKNIVEEEDLKEKIKIVEEASYSAKQVLMKMAVLDNLTDFIYIYSEQCTAVS